MSINAGTVHSKMGLDIKGFRSSLKSAKTDLKSFKKEAMKIGSSIGKVGNKMQDTGKSISVGLTTPIVGAGVGFAKMAGDFEESSNKVATIADTSVKSIKEIEEEVLKLSDEVGVGATQLNEALYQTISATGDTSNAIGYLEIATKAAEGGFTDSATAVDGLTTVLNAYGKKGSKAMQEVSDQMLMAQNFGKTTFGEMSQSIGNVIPVASSLNVSTEELFASIATLTKNGIQTSQSITGLKAAYSNILKPSKQAKEVAEELGIEFNAAHLESVGWAEFLEEVGEKTDGNSEAMAQLFGSTEALNAVTVLATNGSEDFSNALDAMRDSAGATQEAFETMDQGLNDGFADAINSLKNLGIELGQMLIPMIMQFINIISNWINWFKSLEDSTKKIIIKIAGIVAALGPVLFIGGKIVSIIGSLISAFGVVSGAIGVATGAVTGATGATAALGAVFTALTGPVGIVIGVLAALGIAIKILYDKNEDFRKGIQEIWKEVKKIFETSIKLIKDIFEGLIDFIMDLFDVFQAAFSGDWDTFWAAIEELFVNFVENWESILRSVLELIKGLFLAFGRAIELFFSTLWSAVTSLFKTFGGGFLKLVKSVFTSVKTAIKNKWNEIKTDTVNKWNEIKRIVPETIQSMKTSAIRKFDDFKDSIFRIGGKIKDSLSDMFDIKLPHFKLKMGTKSVFGKKIKYPKGFDVDWYDKGGIFTGPQIIGVGEKRPEFVGALDDLRKIVGDEFKNIMQPNEAIRSITQFNFDYGRLSEVLSQALRPLAAAGGANVTLKVGTLVADEKGLRDLERRLSKIRIIEQSRKA